MKITDMEHKLELDAGQLHRENVDLTDGSLTCFTPLAYSQQWF